MFTQLDPVVRLHVVDKGSAHAIGVIERGQDQDLIWVAAIEATGEIVSVPSPHVRLLLGGAAEETAAPLPRTYEQVDRVA
ncbi:hypothetical protein [Novosphingobium sp.]|uniref:hypothetical protein n=1 Tax=Novosphingobium sp. TaxID=1874826 RepID=UPI0038B9CD41